MIIHNKGYAKVSNDDDDEDDDDDDDDYTYAMRYLKHNFQS